jgi:hypothetical protein
MGCVQKKFNDREVKNNVEMCSFLVHILQWQHEHPINGANNNINCW